VFFMFLDEGDEELDFPGLRRPAAAPIRCAVLLGHSARKRLRTLILLDLLLLAACVPGIVNVLAKDDVSTAEGVAAWISVVAFIVLLVALVVLIAVGFRRLAKRS
jgi:uncharacterized membrane protein YhaH (DUF805 family)